MFDKVKALKPRPSADAGGFDFLPDGYAERRRRRRTNAICLSLFVVVVGVVGMTFWLAEKALVEAEAEFGQIDRQYADAARRIEQVRQMRTKQKTVVDRMELTASLLEKMPRSNLVAEITNALPGGVSLTDLTLEARKLAAPAPATAVDRRPARTAHAAPPPPQPLAYETTLILTGIAYTEGQVSDYLNALSTGGYFRHVDLRWVRKGSTAQRSDDTMRSFLIAVTVDPQAAARRGEAPRRVRGLTRLSAE